MSEENKGLGCLIFMGLCVISLIITQKIYYDSRPNSWGPASRTELCKALERDYINDPLCSPSGDEWEEIQLLLESSFTVGVTTRDQVRALLGDYFIETRDSIEEDGTFYDSYGIKRGWSKGNSWSAFFVFDENNILMEIGIWSDD